MWQIAFMTALIAAPAWAQCYERGVLAGYLASQGMELHSWGLVSSGEMHELFLAESGEWAVIETTPYGCSTVISTPDQHHGRLWRPPEENKAIPQSRRWSEGRAG